MAAFRRAKVTSVMGLETQRDLGGHQTMLFMLTLWWEWRVRVQKCFCPAPHITGTRGA